MKRYYITSSTQLLNETHDYERPDLAFLNVTYFQHSTARNCTIDLLIRWEYDSRDPNSMAYFKDRTHNNCSSYVPPTVPPSVISTTDPNEPATSNPIPATKVTLNPIPDPNDQITSGTDSRPKVTLNPSPEDDEKGIKATAVVITVVCLTLAAILVALTCLKKKQREGPESSKNESESSKGSEPTNAVPKEPIKSVGIPKASFPRSPVAKADLVPDGKQQPEHKFLIGSAAPALKSDVQQWLVPGQKGSTVPKSDAVTKVKETSPVAKLKGSPVQKTREGLPPKPPEGPPIKSAKGSPGIKKGAKVPDSPTSASIKSPKSKK